MFIRGWHSVDYSLWKRRDLVTPLGRCGMMVWKSLDVIVRLFIKSLLQWKAVGYNLNSAITSDSLTKHLTSNRSILYRTFRPSLFGKKRYWLSYNVQLQMCAIHKVLVLLVVILDLYR